MQLNKPKESSTQNIESCLATVDSYNTLQGNETTGLFYNSWANHYSARQMLSSKYPVLIKNIISTLIRSHLMDMSKQPGCETRSVVFASELRRP